MGTWTEIKVVPTPTALTLSVGEILRGARVRITEGHEGSFYSLNVCYCQTSKATRGEWCAKAIEAARALLDELEEACRAAD